MTRSDVEIDTVGAAAGKVMREADGNLENAAKALVAWVRKDKVLKQALLEPLVEYACYHAVRRCQITSRDKVWNAPPPKPGMSDAQRVEALARSNLMLFALPIANGKLLRDATRAEVSQASDFYGKQATDMAHKSRWLALIGQSLPDGKTVADTLSEDRLRELQEEATNA